MERWSCCNTIQSWQTDVQCVSSNFLQCVCSTNLFIHGVHADVITHNWQFMFVQITSRTNIHFIPNCSQLLFFTRWLITWQLKINIFAIVSLIIMYTTDVYVPYVTFIKRHYTEKVIFRSSDLLILVTVRCKRPHIQLYVVA